MPLPNELISTADDTTVIGDLDAFMVYVESGQALHDWRRLQASARKELDGFMQTRGRSWHHIVSSRSDAVPTLRLCSDTGGLANG